MSPAGTARRSIACHHRMLNKPWSHRQHYSFSNVWNIAAHILHIQQVKDLCPLATATMSHHSKRLCFRSNQHRGVTDISTMTALFIGGHKGERPDGICRGVGGYSQQQGNAHPLYDSYRSYSRVKVSLITIEQIPNSAWTVYWSWHK